MKLYVGIYGNIYIFFDRIGSDRMETFPINIILIKKFHIKRDIESKNVQT